MHRPQTVLALPIEAPPTRPHTGRDEKALKFSNDFHSCCTPLRPKACPRSVPNRIPIWHRAPHVGPPSRRNHTHLGVNPGGHHGRPHGHHGGVGGKLLRGGGGDGGGRRLGDLGHTDTLGLVRGNIPRVLAVDIVGMNRIGGGHAGKRVVAPEIGVTDGDPYGEETANEERGEDPRGNLPHILVLFAKVFGPVEGNHEGEKDSKDAPEEGRGLGTKLLPKLGSDVKGAGEGGERGGDGEERGAGLEREPYDDGGGDVDGTPNERRGPPLSVLLQPKLELYIVRRVECHAEGGAEPEQHPSKHSLAPKTPPVQPEPD
mmetsp:Transcript_730/g.1779  ORF Transcript_730/g.1779 Transcript_730/m.1779 type:complete len:316 (-) Transcript_730:1563-2510(-)